MKLNYLFIKSFEGQGKSRYSILQRSLDLSLSINIGTPVSCQFFQTFIVVTRFFSNFVLYALIHAPNSQAQVPHSRVHSLEPVNQ